VGERILSSEQGYRSVEEMMLYGVIVGAVLMGTGVLTYFFAPRMGPNPLFGVRIGYTFTDREAWDRANRHFGKLLAIFSAVVLMLSLFFDSVILFAVGILVAAIVPAILSSIEAVRMRESAGFREPKVKEEKRR